MSRLAGIKCVSSTLDSNPHALMYETVQQCVRCLSGDKPVRRAGQHSYLGAVTMRSLNNNQRETQ